MNFEYRGLPWNIVFGHGSLASLPDRLAAMGLSRALVLSTPNQSDDGLLVCDLLGDKAAGLFDQAVMHVPETTVQLAIQEVEQKRADCTVSIGGGSTTGLGKALALKLGLPNIAIPTTFAGSEMTNIWGITGDEGKVTGRDDAVVPSLTLYDPELIMTLPAELAGPSGLNAMAQAVVNVAAPDANPMVSLMALEAVRILSASLPMVMERPTDPEPRCEALFGAMLAAAALGTGITSLHHRLCHTFGGTFNTPHAETHTVLLPHCVAYNAAATSQGTARVAQAMGVTNAAEGLFDLAARVGAPTALREIGVMESDLDRAVEVALANPVVNAEPVTPSRLRMLLQNAWSGASPEPITSQQ